MKIHTLAWFILLEIKNMQRKWSEITLEVVKIMRSFLVHRINGITKKLKISRKIILSHYQEFDLIKLFTKT